MVLSWSDTRSRYGDPDAVCHRQQRGDDRYGRVCPLYGGSRYFDASHTLYGKSAEKEF